MPDRSRRLNRSTLILAAFVVLALARGLLYAAVTPPWQGPDEPRHFEHARLIVDKGRLVSIEDVSVPLEQAVIDSMVRFRFWDFGFYSYPYDPAKPPQQFEQVWAPVLAHELHQQPLYYVLCALVVWPWRAADVTTQLYVMRLLSVLLFAGTVAAAFLTTRELFPTDLILPVVITAGVLWHPMFTFVNNTVNNDALANLLMAWLIWLLVRWYMRGPTVLQGVAIAVLLILGIVTKRTTMFAWPLVAVAVPLYLWGRGKSRWARWAWLVGSAVASAGLVGLVAWVLSGGGGPFLARVMGDLLFGADVVQNPGAYQFTNWSLYARYAESLFRMFWAAFGWANIALEPIWYQILVVIHLVALGGLGLLTVRVWRGRLPLQQGQRRALVLLAISFILTLGIVLAKQIRLQVFLPGDLPQGRFLFPVMVPIIALLAIGLWQWVPARYQRPASAIFLATAVLFDTGCLAGYIIPFYYLR
jgi:hypothetical protein